MPTSTARPVVEVQHHVVAGLGDVALPGHGVDLVEQLLPHGREVWPTRHLRHHGRGHGLDVLQADLVPRHALPPIITEVTASPGRPPRPPGRRTQVTADAGAGAGRPAPARRLCPGLWRPPRPGRPARTSAPGRGGWSRGPAASPGGRRARGNRGPSSATRTMHVPRSTATVTAKDSPDACNTTLLKASAAARTRRSDASTDSASGTSVRLTNALAVGTAAGTRRNVELASNFIAPGDTPPPPDKPVSHLRPFVKRLRRRADVPWWARPQAGAGGGAGPPWGRRGRRGAVGAPSLSPRRVTHARPGAAVPTASPRHRSPWKPIIPSA